MEKILPAKGMRDFLPEECRRRSYLIEKIRAVYSGRLLYSANWNGLNGVAFWEDLDYAGLNGYFNMNPKNDQ